MLSKVSTASALGWSVTAPLPALTPGEAFWDGGDFICRDLGAGYRGVFGLWKFRDLYIYALCTFGMYVLF